MKIFPVLTLLSVFCFSSSCHHAQRAHSQSGDSAFIITVQGDTIPKVIKSEEDWREILSEAEYHVLREEGTERAFTGEYWDTKQKGKYVCRGCGFELFDSSTKFDSGTGWPSFYQPINDHCIARHKDSTFGMVRTEVECARCGGHLGHVFDDGPKPTGLRYCINSISLKLIE